MARYRSGVRVVLLQASMGTAMEHYAGIEVSLESSSVCIVDGTGHVIREAKIASESETLVAWFGGLDLPLTRTRLQVRVNLPSHSLRHGSLRLSTERPLSNLQPGLKCQAHFTPDVSPMRALPRQACPTSTLSSFALRPGRSFDAPCQRANPMTPTR